MHTGVYTVPTENPFLDVSSFLEYCCSVCFWCFSNGCLLIVYSGLRSTLDAVITLITEFFLIIDFGQVAFVCSAVSSAPRTPLSNLIVQIVS